MKTFVFLILLAAFMTMTNFAQTTFSVDPGVSLSLARWRAANYSDVRYKLKITLEKGAPLMKGELEIRVNLTEEGAKNDLVLDWRTTQFAGDKDKPYANVMEVNDKKEPPVVLLNEHIKVPRPFLKTGENVIKIEFSSPIKTSGAAVTRYVDREDGAEYIYSLFVPSDASTAFPVFDQPDLKARFELTVFAPSGWNVVSNTLVAKKVRMDAMSAPTYVFEETKPISTYVFAFSAGEFVEFDERSEDEILNEIAKEKRSRNEVDKDGRTFVSDNEIRARNSKIYVRKSQAEKFKAHAKEVFRLNREGVKFLESYFDYKFPFPKYDLVLIPEFPFRGMEHAGATFLREDSIIFPSEPTANDHISRANVIFHEAAHQWFGDTVTMKWFDDLWLKEGFAEFMAYKTLEKVMPAYNAWKAFYERNKPLAYLTDSTRGTTPIYQEIPNLSAAKSAYGNIVYRKAPSFLRQAEFYLGEEKFQTAVRAFLKKYQFANAEWTDLVKEFEEVKINEIKSSEYYPKLSQRDKEELESFTRWSISKEWADFWVNKPGMPTYRISPDVLESPGLDVSGGATGGHTIFMNNFSQTGSIENYNWLQNIRVLKVYDNGEREEATAELGNRKYAALPDEESKGLRKGEFIFPDAYKNFDKEPNEETGKVKKPLFVFPNYRDYGYGIFLLDEKSRDYVLKNIQNEKDDFLRSMMWGALWDSVRERELAPRDYVELAIRNISVETDALTISTILARVSTAMTYYLSDKQRDELAPRLEAVLLQNLQQAPNTGTAVTYYRAFVNLAAGARAREELKSLLRSGGIEPRKNKTDKNTGVFLRTKDRFDIVTKLLILGDPEAPRLLEELKKTETSDEAKRYAYAVGAAFASREAKEKYFNDFLNNKEISESWIESAFVPFNAVRHSELTLPYLEKALAELPNLKRNRKIFFVNGWLAAFIGGQKDEKALAVVNKFLTDNPNLDKDLRLKILENLDVIERAVKIRAKYSK